MDWTNVDKHPEAICYCRCGAVYRSHAKPDMTRQPPCSVSRKPCPGCGKQDNIWRVSFDPESYTINYNEAQ